MSKLSRPNFTEWTPSRPGTPPLATTDCQVWWIPPDASIPGELTAQETQEAKARPAGPVLEGWRRTRLGVRGILGGIMGQDPTAIRIERSGFGKPHLEASDLHFSVSHSGDHIVIAVGRQPVGVDIETHGRERLSLEIADRYFPRQEAEWLRNLPPHELARNFLKLWVSKEAALKCLGTGLAGYLERTACHRAKDGTIAKVQVDERNFAIHEFALGSFGRGALAVEGTNPAVTLLSAVFPGDSKLPR